jgi:hypothetical protein
VLYVLSVLLSLWLRGVCEKQTVLEAKEAEEAEKATMIHN